MAKYTILEKIPRGFKLNFIKLMRIKDDYNRIARGFAWGAFLAVWPSMPFNTLLAVLCAPVFNGNRLAAVIGSWIVGPFVVAPIYYYASYWLGKLIFNALGFSVTHLTYNQIDGFVRNISYKKVFFYCSKDGLIYLWNHISGFFWAMEVGGLILGIIAAYLSFEILLNIKKWYLKHREKIRKKHENK